MGEVNYPSQEDIDRLRRALDFSLTAAESAETDPEAAHLASTGAIVEIIAATEKASPSARAEIDRILAGDAPEDGLGLGEAGTDRSETRQSL